jgi:hypothetical protein
VIEDYFHFVDFSGLVWFEGKKVEGGKITEIDG